MFEIFGWKYYETFLLEPKNPMMLMNSKIAVDGSGTETESISRTRNPPTLANYESLEKTKLFAIGLHETCGFPYPSCGRFGFFLIVLG